MFAGPAAEPTPIRTTPLAPSAAASRLSRSTAASVWPWVPKPIALEASNWAISCEPGGTAVYTWTWAGSIGGRAWPTITFDEPAQPARASTDAARMIRRYMAIPRDENAENRHGRAIIHLRR